jgi:thymidine kinase
MIVGKTMALIEDYRRMPINDRIAIKPTIDDRYSATSIVSHSGESIPATSVNNLQNIEAIVGDIRNVYIDEGQFFMDLAEKCAALLLLGKSVRVAGLSATAHQRPWQSMSDVMSMADIIVHLVGPECQVCHRHPAAHTMFRSAAARVDPSVIRIGGGDVYVVVCRKCLWGM